MKAPARGGVRIKPPCTTCAGGNPSLGTQGHKLQKAIYSPGNSGDPDTAAGWEGPAGQRSEFCSLPLWSHSCLPSPLTGRRRGPELRRDMFGAGEAMGSLSTRDQGPPSPEEFRLLYGHTVKGGAVSSYLQIGQ